MISGPSPDAASEDEASGQADERVIRDRAFRILDAAMQSRSSLRFRLIRRGFEEHAVDRVIDSLADGGYLDESGFARALVCSQLRRGHGQLYIERYLRARGIPGDVITEILATWPVDEEIDAARRYIERHAHADDVPSLRSAARSILYRRGFSHRAITQVADEE